MHRIGLRRFTRRHVEKPRVEESRFVNKAAIRSMTCVAGLSRWIIVGIDIESVFGYLDCLSG